ncbi:MAG: hypothetical protein ACI9JM_003146 [Halioglobus sp.]|jgi:hypothetical protein
MRSLALFISLCCLVAFAHSDVSPQQRKAKISAAALEAAAGMKRYENYVRYLQPIPDRTLRGLGMLPYVLLADGWSGRLSGGAWTLDNRSVLFVRWEPDTTPKQLFIHGRYLGGEEATRLLVNGQLISETPLNNLTVTLPRSLSDASSMEIELQHLNPLTSAEAGIVGEDDSRLLKFQIEQIRVW